MNPTKIFSVILAVGSPALWAADAHVHGEGHLNIALESDFAGEIELHAPGESILGFEHTAKTAKEKATEQKAIKDLSERFSELLKLPADCSLSHVATKVEVEEVGHTEVESEYTFKCGKSLLGQKLNWAPQKLFPHLKKVEVKILGTQGSHALTLKKAGVIEVPAKL